MNAILAFSVGVHADRSQISSELIVGCGVNILGRTSVGISQYRVMGISPTMVGFCDCSFSQRPKSTVPGNGVIITNCAKVTPALIAISTVASKVAGRSVGKPKMNEPSTCTPCALKVCNCLASASPE